MVVQGTMVLQLEDEHLHMGRLVGLHGLAVHVHHTELSTDSLRTTTRRLSTRSLLAQGHPMVVLVRREHPLGLAAVEQRTHQHLDLMLYLPQHLHREECQMTIHTHLRHTRHMVLRHQRPGPVVEDMKVHPLLHLPKGQTRIR